MVGVSCQIVDLCSELITALAARLYCRNFFPERMTCADYLTAILCVDADVTRYDPVCGESLPKEPDERNEGALRREPNFSRQTRLPFLMRNFWLAIQTQGQRLRLDCSGSHRGLVAYALSCSSMAQVVWAAILRCGREN